ncbi:hypothetical protein [Streptomyces thermogriseus]|uniref:Secreted protein n=1 Tax=Streptomyces thermogriseus TaxID=75292 RepID=A0ABP4DPL8_9ACTN
MLTMAIETGDAATWASSVVALLALLLTAVQYWQQSKRQAQQKEEQAARDRAQAEASQIATRQAEAQERRAYAMEQALQRVVRILDEPRQGSLDALSSDAVEGAPAWQLAHKQGNAYVLRNVGTAVATGVRVDVGQHPRGLTRALPEDAVVRPQEAVEFLLLAAWGAPRPDSIRVVWDGGEQTLPVTEP